MMTLNINDTLLTEEDMRDRDKVLAIPGCDEALADFLLAWWDDRDFVVGHTSGSTGEPKRIELSKQSMCESARRTNAFFGLKHGDAILLCLSANYIAGKMMVVRAIVGGLNLYVETAASLPNVAGRFDLVSMVPMQVHALRESAGGRERMERIRCLLVGGGPLRRAEAEWLHSLSVKTYISYGMTETVSHVALALLEQGSEPLYEALPDVRFSTDERECLVIHADYLAGSPFVTNDVVRLRSDHSFSWLGRWDNVINTGGVKVFPEKMEKKVGDLIEAPFYFTSEDDAKFGQRVALRIESAPFDTADLLRRMAERLTPYEMPKNVTFLPRFERTDSGKVKRR